MGTAKSLSLANTESVWKSRGESRELQEQRKLEVRRVLEKLQKQRTQSLVSQMFQS
jgi:hypothetical protein